MKIVYSQGGELRCRKSRRNWNGSSDCIRFTRTNWRLRRQTNGGDLKGRFVGPAFEKTLAVGIIGGWSDKAFNQKHTGVGCLKMWPCCNVMVFIWRLRCSGRLIDGQVYLNQANSRIWSRVLEIIDTDLAVGGSCHHLYFATKLGNAILFLWKFIFDGSASGVCDGALSWIWSPRVLAAFEFPFIRCVICNRGRFVDRMLGLYRSGPRRMAKWRQAWRRRTDVAVYHCILALVFIFPDGHNYPVGFLSFKERHKIEPRLWPSGELVDEWLPVSKRPAAAHTFMNSKNWGQCLRTAQSTAQKMPTSKKNATIRFTKWPSSNSHR